MALPASTSRRRHTAASGSGSLHRHPRPYSKGRLFGAFVLCNSGSHHLALSSCWIQGYSRDYCCDLVHGPNGNEACWDDVFNYEPCCTQLDGSEVFEAHGGSSGSGVGVGDSPEALALEKSFGRKLDESLAQNNITLREVEEDLRQTLAAPENRSIATPMTSAFLALVLFRLGRDWEAHQQLQQYLENDFTISHNGAWVGHAAAGYHMHDTPFADALVGHFKREGARSVADFGCGLGLYVRDLRAAGLRVGGFDGNPVTGELTEGRCQQLDLSRSFDLGTRWDWVLSLEVAEHIPPELEAEFVGNLQRHSCFGLVLSWGNQAGEGHVNNKPREEVIRLFEALGFANDDLRGESLRSVARLPWLQETVLVLRRVDIPPECGASPAPHHLP